MIFFMPYESLLKILIKIGLVIYTEVAWNKLINKKGEMQFSSNTRKDTPKMEFIYKKLCIYSHMFKLQSPSKYSPFDVVHLSKLFSTAQNSFWTCQFWCLFMLQLFYVSPLPHRQNISLWGLFPFGKTDKSPLGWDWVNRVGPGVLPLFWSKTAERSAWCGQVLS